MSAPTFSVIVPCWNGAATLDEALASVRAQSTDDLETIVVDDGSTDGSVAIAAAHAAADRRVVVLRQPNRGVGAARNAGLAVARGRYVSFLDADDVFEPGKLITQGRALDHAPQADLALCDGCVIDAASRIVWPSLVDLRRFAGHPSLLAVCLLGGPFPPVVPLVRTDAVREVGGFDEDRVIGGWADIDLWMRLGLRGVDYVVVPDRLVRYRSTATSMSADTPAMAAAADRVYAALFARDPAQAAAALREAHQRVRDLEAARDDLRALAVRQLATAPAETAVAVDDDRHRAASAALLEALARESAGRPRPLWIWGAGSAGRALLAQLEATGGQVAAFVDSDPARAGTHIAGVPVVSPAALQQPGPQPYVVVASMHAPAIGATLDRLGWRRDADFHVAAFDEARPAPTSPEVAA